MEPGERLAVVADGIGIGLRSFAAQTRAKPRRGARPMAWAASARGCVACTARTLVGFAVDNLDRSGKATLAGSRESITTRLFVKSVGETTEVPVKDARRRRNRRSGRSGEDLNDLAAPTVHDRQTRAAVVSLLVEDGPLTAGEIADRLGISAAGCADTWTRWRPRGCRGVVVGIRSARPRPSCQMVPD